MSASIVPPTAGIALLALLAAPGCSDSEGRPEGTDVRAAEALGGLVPSSAWDVDLHGVKHVALTAEESDGRKTYYNYNYSEGTYWDNLGSSFDDLPADHKWQQLTLVDGIRPWGSNADGHRAAGQMTAGYVFTDKDNIDRFVFMNQSRYWNMCTANCDWLGLPLLGQIRSGRLQDLPGGHPWEVLRTHDNQHAWRGAGITATFQHQDGAFYMFNEGEYWILNPTPELHPRFTNARTVHELTGGVLSRVSGALSLAPGNEGAESIILLDGSRWVEFSPDFSTVRHQGSSLDNMFDCLRWGESCDGSDDSEPSDAAPPASGTIDVVDYLALDCASKGSATRLGSETLFTYPVGMQGDRGRFLFMKGGDDGKGFEEWFVDDSWLYLSKDTTWSYSNGQCDMECGVPSSCNRRWAGESGDYAYTVYFDPEAPTEPAKWLPRHVSPPLDGDFGAPISMRMGIDAGQFASCDLCPNGNQYTHPDQTREIRMKRYSHWHGFDDALEVYVSNGPGSGEHYVYARDVGWVGFFHDGESPRVASETGITSSKEPSFECEGFSQRSICDAVEG